MLRCKKGGFWGSLFWLCLAKRKLTAAVAGNGKLTWQKLFSLKIWSVGPRASGEPEASSRLGDDHGHAIAHYLWVMCKNVSANTLMYSKPCRLGQIAIVACPLGWPQIPSGDCLKLFTRRQDWDHSLAKTAIMVIQGMSRPLYGYYTLLWRFSRYPATNVKHVSSDLWSNWSRSKRGYSLWVESKGSFLFRL